MSSKCYDYLAHIGEILETGRSQCDSPVGIYAEYKTGDTDVGHGAAGGVSNCDP